MTAPTHLKSLQALEMAIREGSLKDAALRLGITPAAVGQRIRAIEDYLGTDLLARGRSGIQPAAGLQPALADLKIAFAALDRAVEALDFQRQTEIHIVAETDFADLWLQRRLHLFRAASPNVRFCVNGVGDVPMRLGAPDFRVTLGGDEAGEMLFTDWLIPVVTPPNMFRIAGRDPQSRLDGMPLLHINPSGSGPSLPGWPDWFAAYGGRGEGLNRGAHFQTHRDALEALRGDTGFLLCGLAMALEQIDAGTLVMPFPPREGLLASAPYRLWMRGEAQGYSQHRRFRDWIMSEARQTAARIGEVAGPNRSRRGQPPAEPPK